MNGLVIGGTIMLWSALCVLAGWKAREYFQGTDHRAGLAEDFDFTKLRSATMNCGPTSEVRHG